MQTGATSVLLGSAAIAISIYCQPVHAGGKIIIDNQSASTIKIAGPGGSAVVDAGADPVEVTFDDEGEEQEVGVNLAAWWVSKPLELCQIFVPWDRTVVVSGKSAIRCRSN